MGVQKIERPTPAKELFREQIVLGQSWTRASASRSGWMTSYRRVLFVPKNEEMVVQRRTRRFIFGLVGFEMTESCFSLVFFPMQRYEITLRFGRDTRRY